MSLGFEALTLFVLVCCASVSCVWTSADLRRNNYNKYRPPLVNGTSPVIAILKLEIVTILDVDEFGQSFTVDIDYKLTWNDYRLNLPATETDFPLILDISWKDKLWIPDVYFKNALDSKLVQGTISPITHLEVSRNSDISLIARMTVQLICDMELFAYPHDRQQCFLDSTSLSYKPTHLQLQWDSFTVDESIYFPKFRIDSYSTASNCTCPNIHKVGDESCVRAIVHLSRKVSFYIVRFYAPTLLITSATFLGYYIKTATIPARIAINLTPFLSLITMHNIINSEVRVSYVVALHIWMFVCMFTTIIGLGVFFLALAADHLEEMRKKKEKRRQEEEGNEGEKDVAAVTAETGTDNEKGAADVVMNSNERDAKLGIPVEPACDRGKGDEEKQTLCLMTKIWESMRSSLRKWNARSDEKDGKDEVQKDGDAGKKKKGRKHNVNPVDRVARPLVPLCFFSFMICYFVYFQMYSSINQDA